MSTAAIIISIIYVIALTTSIVPLAVGLEPKGIGTPARRVVISLVFGATHALMALIGYLLGTLVDYLFGDTLRYLVFAMMIIVAIKMFIDSMKVLKGKRLYSFTSNWGFLLVAILTSMNTLLMGIVGPGFMPFGDWYYLVLAGIAALWTILSIRVPYGPKMLRNTSFIEFSGSVFMLVIAILFMFTDLMQI